MQEGSAKNPIITKTITTTRSKAISVLNTKNWEDLIPYERLVHVNNKLNQGLLPRKDDAEDLPVKQFYSTINLTNEIPKASIKAGKRKCLSADNTIYKQIPYDGDLLAVKQSSFMANVSHNRTKEIPKASVKVGKNKQQEQQQIITINTINKKIPNEGAVKQLYSTVKVAHDPTNEIPKASIKVDRRQCLSLNNEIFKHLPQVGELLPAKQSSFTASALHKATNGIPKDSFKAGKSQFLSSSSEIYKQLPPEGELLGAQHSTFTAKVLHNPTNEIPKASIRVVKTQYLFESQEQKLINAVNKKIPNEGAVEQLYSTVKVPHDPTNEFLKASVKVDKSKFLPTNNTIYKQLPQDGKDLALKRSSSTENMSHKTTNEIPKASIKVGESKQQKIKCLPSNNTVRKHLSNEEVLLAEQQTRYTDIMPHSPTNKSQQHICLSANKTIIEHVPRKEEHLKVKPSYSMINEEIPKASVKVGKSTKQYKCLPSNNTNYKEKEFLAAVQSFSMVKVSHKLKNSRNKFLRYQKNKTKFNEIPKAKIKTG